MISSQQFNERRRGGWHMRCEWAVVAPGGFSRGFLHAPASDVAEASCRLPVRERIFSRFYCIRIN